MASPPTGTLRLGPTRTRLATVSRGPNMDTPPLIWTRLATVSRGPVHARAWVWLPNGRAGRPGVARAALRLAVWRAAQPKAPPDAAAQAPHTAGLTRPYGRPASQAAPPRATVAELATIAAIVSLQLGMATPTSMAMPAAGGGMWAAAQHQAGPGAGVPDYSADG
eukprot:1086389-Prymnesium_polylepis.1